MRELLHIFGRLSKEAQKLMHDALSHNNINSVHACLTEGTEPRSLKGAEPLANVLCLSLDTRLFEMHSVHA